MKKILYIFFFLFTLSGSSFAQDDAEDGAGKLKEKMTEYIQNKLQLSKAEAEKFQPVFMDYLKELRSTKQEYKSDRILLQQKIAEVRLHYRDQFRPIVGEKRSNEVFTHEHEFIQNVINERNNRLQNRQENAPAKRFKSVL